MYRIIGADGKPYGPVSADQLRQWMQEGRVNAQTQALAEGTEEWKPLSQFPEFGLTSQIPPAGPAPHSLGEGGPPRLAALPTAPSAELDSVSGPAIGLIILGALNLFFGLAWAASSLIGFVTPSRFGMAGSDINKLMSSIAGSADLALSMISVIGGAFILYGGIRMRKLESYGLCMAASVLAMIPCLSLCCPIGLPIGIWALVVLSKPEVKAAFH